MADVDVWTKNPFQLLDFILIGEKYTSLNRVTNAIARIGFLIAIILAYSGVDYWWVVGLSFLFISVLFYHFNRFSKCSSVSTMLVESFTPVPPEYHGYTRLTMPETEPAPEFEYLQEPRDQLQSLTEGLLPETRSFVETEDLGLDKVTTYVHSKVTDSMVETADEEVNTMRAQLEQKLVPDEYTTQYFQPYTIYRNRDPIYSTMGST